MIIDYSRFDESIKKHDLKARWGDTLFEMTEAEKEKHVEMKYLGAKQEFTKMMNSNKNDDSYEYHQWAIITALKLKTRKATHRASLNKKK